MNDKEEIGMMGKEQKVAIDNLEEILHFLKSVQIKDEDVIANIKKPLDKLKSSLKYIPTESFFETIPTEIKTKILNYLCDTNAFTAAAVCLDWKQILGSRFTARKVAIGDVCCGIYCRDNMCLKPVEVLKASATHRLDVYLSISDHIYISDPIKELDPKVVTDVLLSVSKFSLEGTCTHESESGDDSDWFDSSSESNSTECECDVNPLSSDQLEDLFSDMEIKDEIMEKVKLVCLDLNELNQDRLANCFVYKIKSLTLREDKQHGKMFDVDTLINKLSQESTEFELKKLTLDILEYPNEVGLEILATALCNVESVKLNENVPLESATQLIENILSDVRPVKIKTLILGRTIDFRTLINPEDLKKLLNKMTKLELEGTFTLEQEEAAKSLPDVEVWGPGRKTFIQKGPQHVPS